MNGMDEGSLRSQASGGVVGSRVKHPTMDDSHDGLTIVSDGTDAGQIRSLADTLRHVIRQRDELQAQLEGADDVLTYIRRGISEALSPLFTDAEVDKLLISPVEFVQVAAAEIMRLRGIALLCSYGDRDPQCPQTAAIGGWCLYHHESMYSPWILNPSPEETSEASQEEAQP